MNPTELIKMKILNEQNKPKSTRYHNQTERAFHRQSFDYSGLEQQQAKQKHKLNSSTIFVNDHLIPPLASRQSINNINVRNQPRKIQFDYKNQAEKLNQICQELYKENQRLRYNQGTFQRDRIIWNRRINQLEGQISKYHSILKNKNRLIEGGERNSQHRAHHVISHRRTSSNMNGNSSIIYQNDQNQLRTLAKQLQEKEKQLKKYVQKEARYIQIYVQKEQLQQKIRQLQDINYTQKKKLEDMSRSSLRDNEQSMLKSCVIEEKEDNHLFAYEEKLKATLLQSKYQNERLTNILMQKENKIKNLQAQIEQTSLKQQERIRQYENNEAYLKKEIKNLFEETQRLRKRIESLEAQLHEKNQELSQISQIYQEGQLKIESMVQQIEKLKQEIAMIERAQQYQGENAKNREFQVIQVIRQNECLREQIGQMQKSLKQLDAAKNIEISNLFNQNKSLLIKIAYYENLFKQKFSFLAMKLEEALHHYTLLLDQVQKAAEQERKLKVEIDGLCEKNIKFLCQNYKLSKEEAEILNITSRANLLMKPLQRHQIIKS